VGLHKHLPGQRALFFALAAGVLFAYGWTVSAPPWDIGKLIGILCGLLLFDRPTDLMAGL
jgi:small multidrug resistance family-3 protein